MVDINCTRYGTHQVSVESFSLTEMVVQIEKL